jgi:hypothetical protein
MYLAATGGSERLKRRLRSCYWLSMMKLLAMFVCLFWGRTMIIIKAKSSKIQSATWQLRVAADG